MNSRSKAAEDLNVEALLKQNLANIRAKLDAGRTLTAGELALLRSVESGGEQDRTTFARNLVQLAQLLGVDRSTVTRARREPGCPKPRADGRHDVVAWREFLRVRAGGAPSPDPDAEADESSRDRHRDLQNEKIEFQLAVLKRQYVPAADVEKWGAQIGAAIRKVISQIHLVAPSVVGATVAEAEQILKGIEDDVLSQLHQLGANLNDARNEPPA